MSDLARTIEALLFLSPQPVDARDLAEATEATEGQVAEAVELLREEAGLVTGVYPELDVAAFLHGDLTPVFFGSALKEFGIDELLAGLGAFAPPPGAQPARGGPVAPSEPRCSGFIFKVDRKSVV